MKLVYTGQIYPGKQDPSLLFEAIRQLLEENKIGVNDVEVCFYGDNVSVLESLVFKFGLSSVVKLAPQVSRKASLALQRESTAVIFLDWLDPKQRVF